MPLRRNPQFQNPSTPPARLGSDSVERNAQYFEAQSQLNPNHFEVTSIPTELLQQSLALEDPPRPSSSRGHARKASNSLGSLFGSGRWNRSDHDENVVVGYAAPHRGHSPPKKKLGRSKHSDEDDSQTARCATCGTNVKWPKGYMEFRCSTCLMINDLKSRRTQTIRPNDLAHGQLPQGTRQRGSPSGETPPKATSISPTTPLTLENTKSIIERCIANYIRASKYRRVGHSPPKTVTPPLSPASNALNLSLQNLSPSRVIALDSLQPLESSTPAPPLRAPPPVPPAESIRNAAHLIHSERMMGSQFPGGSLGRSLPLHNQPQRLLRKPVPGEQSHESHLENTASHTARSLPPNPSKNISQLGGSAPRERSMSEAPPVEAKSIFRPLEEYLSRSYANWDVLNASFSSIRRRARQTTRGEEKAYGRRNGVAASSFPDNGHESSLSALDAKMLMIGDVAENGLLWAGKDENVEEDRGNSDSASASPESLVSSKSANVHWTDVKAWYRSILRAGDGWEDIQAKMSSQSRDENSNTPIDEGEADTVRENLAEARAHLVRSFMRMTEGLLKRPGRPLRNPNDTRFLLIILANPLFHNEGVPQKDATGIDDARFASTLEPPGIRKHEPIPIYGLVKRVFGLLANSSPETHRYVTSWLCRYPEHEFRKLVALVHRFVIHRLGRQHARKRSNSRNTADDLVPTLTGTHADTPAQLHAALGRSGQPLAGGDLQSGYPLYSEDWQLRVAAKTMAVLFAANMSFLGERDISSRQSVSSLSRHNMKYQGQLLSTNEFYSTSVDMLNVITDFECWESSREKFSFCQFPFFLSVSAKIRILEYDAKRQMEIRAREAFFNTILGNRVMERYLTLRVRRDCLVEDSLKNISEAVGVGTEEVKKALKVQFVGEEGIDAGGLRKEWFQVLTHEMFDPKHGMFVYDEDSGLCYFNPFSFETSDQFYLIGAVLGLAIYNSNIIDVALPSFTFKKLLSSATPVNGQQASYNRMPLQYTLEDLAEFRPALAKGLRQLLEFDGNVKETFCRDFVAETSRYGTIERVPLCDNGYKRAVTNDNREEFVSLYVRYLLDRQVTRQFEPFKRGFFTVCGGNALSLFQPEEIELLIRGSDEGVDVDSLKAVAVYENWQRVQAFIKDASTEIDLVRWFWELWDEARVSDQRKLLAFITGSDRIPVTGAASLQIKISYGGKDRRRYPIARTCFNSLLLYAYRTKEDLADKLWTAVNESEGFGLR